MKIRKMNVKNMKRSQSEIVGFVVIVVIVVVIGLFLLVFYLRQPTIRTESIDVQNFLKSSISYTTSCTVGSDPQPLDIGDLMKKCYEGTECVDGKPACDALNDTYADVLDQAWKINSNRPVNYYSLDMYYRVTKESKDLEDEEETIKNEPILNIENGNCTGSIVGGQNFIYYRGGNIISDLKICYK
jgi:hypothetical protein